MHSRTRKRLLGAALTVLAVACAAVLGASNAAAASQHSATVHKISACGYTASSPGTYELTKNVTDSGSGTCITLTASNVTLYLDGHTITGTGSDTCVYAEGNSSHSENTNDRIFGGTSATPTKKHPQKWATLSGCDYGVYVYWNLGTQASYLKITSPSNEGIYEDYAAGMRMSNIMVSIPSGSAYGFYGQYGADNALTHVTVDNNGTSASFEPWEETADSFTGDTAKDSYNGTGNSSYGFADYYSSQNVFSHDTSTGNKYGFYLYEDTYGTVTATYDTAVDTHTTSGVGFYTYYDFQEADYAASKHTLVSHDKANGFLYGFEDDTDDAYAVAETFTKNTATNYSDAGFYLDYPTDYTMTGNVADGNTKQHHYNSSAGTTYGFYFSSSESYYPFKNFSGNTSMDNYWGYFSDSYMVPGKKNVAKHNKYASYDVEVTS